MLGNKSVSIVYLRNTQLVIRITLVPIDIRRERHHIYIPELRQTKVST